MQDSIQTQSKLRDYYYVTKPNVISLLVFTGAASYVAAAGRSIDFISLIIVIVSVWLGSAA
ncbi:MAG: hypothetical protein M1587_03135, partial [Thaumarchaeota archaeon]|nr:hypothetical protein [Nitrososphaerota archaeon]